MDDAMAAGTKLAHEIDFDKHMGMTAADGLRFMDRHTNNYDHFHTVRWMAGFYSTLARRIYDELQRERQHSNPTTHTDKDGSYS